ncbi:hypothetical protein Poli38472_001079 [Pythium oligandrum]|uniref:Microsomal glutathione S-transferase 1 n=1 Tax=Pythium oligandrum TaxID=41045 RepID=A0A8K1FSV2_PYTOL|nr:hypothetical protein Poli38472_001079 [Pythium oligandrum]|eukprot:TMW68923.1 hypothetical protein Poli38472_001079 [Pythium oligandrum]
MVLGSSTASVKTFVVCTSVLFTKFFLTTMIQGVQTFKAGGRPPEDGKLGMAKGHPKQTYGLVSDEKDEKILKEREIEHRWRRIIANDLESMPLALFVFASGLFFESDERVHIGAMVVYTMARCAHTIAYAKQKQPHRARFFMLGSLCIFIGMGNALFAALSA